MTDRRIARAVSALAHAWTWGVGLYLVYRTSLVAMEGLQALLALLAPIVISGLFLLVAVSEPGGRAVAVTLLWVTAMAMLGFCVLGAASIGLLYVPGALAMLIAAAFATSASGST